MGADAVIHFGRTCLTPTQRLPVLNVYTSLPLDLPALEQALSSVSGPLALAYDVQYHRPLQQLGIYLQPFRPLGDAGFTPEQEGGGRFK